MQHSFPQRVPKGWPARKTFDTKDVRLGATRSSRGCFRLIVVAFFVVLTAGCSFTETGSLPLGVARTETAPTGIPPRSSTTSSTPNAATSTSSPQPVQSHSDSDPLPTVRPPAGPDPGAGGPVKPGGPVVVWLPIGPVGPVDPGWYEALRNRNCSLLPTTSNQPADIWVAAAALCSALASGDDTLWAQGTSQLKSIPRPSNCLQATVHDVLNGLVSQHFVDPTASVSVVPGSGTACPLELTGLYISGSTMPQNNPQTSVCGGETVWLVGQMLDVHTVLVGQLAIPAQATANTFSFTAPSVPAGTMRVTAVSSAGALGGAADLTFTGDPSSCGLAPQESTESPPPNTTQQPTVSQPPTVSATPSP